MLKKCLAFSAFFLLSSQLSQANCLQYGAGQAAEYLACSNREFERQQMQNQMEQQRQQMQNQMEQQQRQMEEQQRQMQNQRYQQQNNQPYYLSP